MTVKERSWGVYYIYHKDSSRMLYGRLIMCVFPQSVGVSRSPDRQWPMRSLRCRLVAGTFKVRSLPWLIFACLTVQVQRFIAQMQQLYVAPLFCFSQVGCKEDQGETENQQSSVWRGFLFWGIFFSFSLYCWWRDLPSPFCLHPPVIQPLGKGLKDLSPFISLQIHSLNQE